MIRLRGHEFFQVFAKLTLVGFQDSLTVQIAPS
jgi:hypothetical protein